MGNVYRRAVSGRNFVVLQPIGQYGPFKLDAKFAFSDFGNWGGAHNDGFAACVEACRGKQCIVDVGAHVGLVSLPIASVMAPGARLISFEPGRANRSVLQRHLTLNGFNHVVVEGLLVGREEASAVDFYEMSDVSGMNSVVPGAMGNSYAPTPAMQTTLDAYCEKYDLAPEVIKIDVEGAELDVLRGAQRVLLRYQPTIFLSVHPRQIALLGESLQNLSELISTLGYECSHVDGSGVTNFALREYVLTPRETKKCL